MHNNDTGEKKKKKLLEKQKKREKEGVQSTYTQKKTFLNILKPPFFFNDARLAYMCGETVLF